ncbi:MAG: RES domain-containing protein [Chitinophagaceae bacterium]|nr:MAG: RES domain-containing protein [Chitinophagaceae bacterium]
MRFIGDILKVGFFYYGPRLWRLGSVIPLEKLQESKGREEVIREILIKYPAVEIEQGATFYRLRKNPVNPVAATEYDSPPGGNSGLGRMDSRNFPVLYCSTGIDTCIHECRVTLEDDLFVAKLSCKVPLRVLDLSVQVEEDGDEFESLGVATGMLFNAPIHAYEIIRAIAKAAFKKGLDGVIYPSYFSAVHSADLPFVNVAFFGRPIAENKLAVDCVNRLVLQRVKYEYSFGPGAF